MASIFFSSLLSQKTDIFPNFIHKWKKKKKMINQYRKLETSAKKREIYVPNKFFLFYILHPLS